MGEAQQKLKYRIAQQDEMLGKANVRITQLLRDLADIELTVREHMDERQTYWRVLLQKVREAQATDEELDGMIAT